MIDFNMLTFFWPALVAGIMVACVAGPLGSFIVWRRLAYFGDSLAHTALLGVGLSLVFALPAGLMVLLTCLVVAAALSVLIAKPDLASDTLLAILAYSFLSAGLVVVSLSGDTQLDVMAYLFGDLLGVLPSDLPVIGLGVALMLAVIVWQWRALLAITVDEELAQVEGRPVARLRLLLMVLLAVAIAAAMKVVGVLLITALLVIPASAARRLASTPEQMAVYAAVIGGVSVLVGFVASVFWNVPTGPAVVLTATAFFIVTNLFKKSTNRA